MTKGLAGEPAGSFVTRVPSRGHRARKNGPDAVRPVDKVPANAQGECGEDQVAGCFNNGAGSERFHRPAGDRKFFWPVWRAGNVRAPRFGLASRSLLKSGHRVKKAFT